MILIFQDAMSRCAGIQRDADAIRRLMARGREALARSVEADEQDPALLERLLLRDLLITQQSVLSAMLLSMEQPGPGVIMTRGGESRRQIARPLPRRELWFERVWRDYRAKNGLEGGVTSR